MASVQNPHNKIIISAAKEIFKGQNIFQKYSSRCFYEDNGYYLTIIEFQPSSWSRGSYLNVGMCFLWYNRDHTVFDYGHRVHSKNNGSQIFIRYEDDDEKFRSQALDLAKAALERAEELRKFRDLEYAKSELDSHSDYHDCWRRLMLSVLAKDGQIEKNLNICAEYAHTIHPAYMEFFSANTKELRKLVDFPDEAAEHVQSIINSQRDYFRAHGKKKIK